MGKSFFIFKVNTVEKVLRDLFPISAHPVLSEKKKQQLCISLDYEDDLSVFYTSFVTDIHAS